MGRTEIPPLGRIGEILDTPLESEPENPVAPDELGGSIRFEDVQVGMSVRMVPEHCSPARDCAEVLAQSLRGGGDRNLSSGVYDIFPREDLADQ